MGRLLIQFPGTTTAKALTETLSKNVIIVDEDLHQLRLHDGSTAGGHLIGGSSGSGVPVGTIIPFAGNSIPQGYLLCDGSAISRTTYASLFAVIGTIYGSGDGNSTFNLPNFNKTLPIYDSTAILGTSTNGKAPNIKGGISTWANYSATFAESALYSGSRTNWGATSASENPKNDNLYFDASIYNSVYDDNATGIVPAGIYTLYCIKY